MARAVTGQNVPEQATNLAVAKTKAPPIERGSKDAGAATTAPHLNSTYFLRRHPINAHSGANAMKPAKITKMTNKMRLIFLYNVGFLYLKPFCNFL